MKRILFTSILAVLFAVSVAGSQAMAAEALLKWSTDSEAEADAIQSEFDGRHDYNALMARKLADAVLDELGQHDLVAARQFLILAKEHAAKARGAQ